MPSDGEVYRFEIGGGHWIFGRDRAVLHFIRRLAPVRSYRRRSTVYFPKRDLYVPYPIQNYLSHLGTEMAVRVLTEMTSTSTASWVTMAEWLQVNFGRTLCEIFFHPFRELYTSALWKLDVTRKIDRVIVGSRFMRDIAIQHRFSQKVKST
jgi:protoporphyrinogen oxidase